MSAANPYERRRGLGRDGQALAGVGIDVGGRAESPLTFRELEAMVYSAVRRGREAAREQEFRAVGQAKREAWKEGHEAGQEDGRDALLLAIDQMYGEYVLGVRGRARQLLEAARADPRKVTKSDLVTMLDEARGALTRLVEAHHARFEDPPF